MTMRDIERALIEAVRAKTNRPKLRLKDLLAWSSGDLDANDGEDRVIVSVPGMERVVAIIPKASP